MLSVEEALAQAPLFQGLPEDTLRQLALAVQHRHYDAGDVVFKAGDEGTSLFVVAAGEVRIQLERDSDGRLVVLALRVPGENFGELSLVDEGKRSATAVATEDGTDLLYLGRSAFLDLLHREPEAFTAILKVLGQMLRDANLWLYRLSTKDANARMAAALMELAELHGVETDEGVLIDRPVPAGELGGRTGLQLEDIIRVADGRITVVRPDILRAWM
jgi:CRP/FNR family cyclic AMP-dependent transcriptional regulator